MPIYDVERKRFDEFTSSSAERTRLSPASARCLRSALRAETNAVSDMDKRDAGPPFRRVPQASRIVRAMTPVLTPL